MAGERVLVIGLDAGAKAVSRLESMGLVPGAELEILSTSTRGPVLVSLGDTRFMVERGIASKVLVV
jgi:ferrous iron transport protein A